MKIEFANTELRTTDEEYAYVQQQLEHLFDTLSQMSSSGYYVVDCCRHNYLYVSENMAYWCGHTSDEFKMLGYDLYAQYVPQEDLEILEEIHAAAFRQIDMFPDTERSHYSLSYDFHFVVNGIKMMVNKRITPFLQKNGKFWLLLCKIALSNNKTVGNAILKKNTDKTFYEYCLDSKKWICKTLPILSVKEKAILRLVAQGMSNKEIGEQLLYSEQTIKTYRKILTGKLQTNNTTEAMMYTLNNDLFLIK